MNEIDTPGQRLRWARENKTQYATGSDAARAFGWPISTYLGHENGDRRPSIDAATRYAAAYHVPLAWILTGGPLPSDGAPPQPGRPLDIVSPAMKVFPVTTASNARRDIPVWSAVLAGDDQGTLILSDQPIDWISRSDRMVGVANPFAFYIMGDSMRERFVPGDMAVVNPSAPMQSGADCVFIRQDPEDGQMYGLVKRLLRASSSTWRTEQLNPRKNLELPRTKWTKAYPIAETRHRT